MTSGKSGKLLGHFEYKKDDAEGAERKGRAMATKILEKIQEIRGENALLGIMSDSTNENTGWENGAIACLEQKMGKNLFWLVCSLHTLERQLRCRLIISITETHSSKANLYLKSLFSCSAVIKALAGDTTGPRTWTGAIGELMATATELPFNPRFRKVDKGPALPEMEESLLKSLSHDQHVAFRFI